MVVAKHTQGTIGTAVHDRVNSCVVDAIGNSNDTSNGRWEEQLGLGTRVEGQRAATLALMRLAKGHRNPRRLGASGADRSI